MTYEEFVKKINDMDKEKRFPTKEEVIDYVWENWTGDYYSQDDLQDVAYDVFRFITDKMREFITDKMREDVMNHVWEKWDGDCYSQNDLQDVAFDIYKFITE